MVKLRHEAVEETTALRLELMPQASGALGGYYGWGFPHLPLDGFILSLCGI